MKKHSAKILLLTAFVFAVGCNGKGGGTTPVVVVEAVAAAPDRRTS